MSISNCPIKGHAVIEGKWNEQLGEYVPTWTRADEAVHIDGLLITDVGAKLLLEELYDIKEPCIYAGVYTLHGYLRDGAKGEV